MNLRTVITLTTCLVACVSCNSIPRGYVVNKDDGLAYRLVYQANTWPVARDRCKEEGAKLAVPKTKEEFSFIQKLVRGMYYPGIKNGSGYKLLVWLGINNLDDYKVWKNVDGENIEESEFHTWAGENGNGYSDDPAEPHCAGIDAVNPGLRDWWCHHRQPYLCQINTNAI